MKLGTDSISTDSFHPEQTYGNLVYLVDGDPEELIKKFDAIKQPKKLLSAYGLNGRHYLVVFVDGIRKRTTKKG